MFLITPYDSYRHYTTAKQPIKKGVNRPYFTQKSIAHCAKRPTLLWASFKKLGSGSWIWTNDLRVMSPTSYQTAPSRINVQKLYTNIKKSQFKFFYICLIKLHLNQMVAGAGFEPTTFGLWARRATRLLHPASTTSLQTPNLLVIKLGAEGGTWTPTPESTTTSR